MDDAVIDLLIGFATQEHSALVDYTKFLEYAEQYGYNNNLTELIHKVRDQNIEIIPTLMQWEYKGACTLFRKESVVDSILIHNLLKELITAIYMQIEQNPEIPFPGDEYFPFTIPEKIIHTIDVHAEFVDYLADIDTMKQPLARLVFKDGINNLVIPREIIKTRLIECTMVKLGRYLQFKMNTGYMHNRLENALSGNLDAIKNMVNDIITKPRKAVQQICEADDFSFRFFSQFTAIIVKDYRDKKTKHVDEHGFVQSAHLLSLFAGFQKSVAQRDYQRNLELSHLEKLVRKPPYAFSLRDLYDLKDNRGTRYSEKYSKDFIIEFIRRLTKVSDPSRVPELVSIKVSENRDYFIHKDYVVPLFLNGLKDASSALYREYIDEWQTLLKNNTRLPSMRHDDEFQTELEFKVRTRYPLLHALRNPYLLQIIRNDADLSEAQKTLVDDCFSSKNTLRPLSVLLDLQRDKIFTAVKTLLPVWYTWPVIKHIFFLFKWLLGRTNRGFKSQALRLWQEVKTEFKQGADREYSKLIESGKKIPEASPVHQATRQEAVARFRTHIDKLKAEVIGARSDLAALLDELKEKWNPLYEQNAKDNLVEDVNCFIRDYMRRIGKTLRVRPPTAVQVREHALHLTQNKNLASIRKKETLKTYIEAYIIKILEEMYKVHTR